MASDPAFVDPPSEPLQSSFDAQKRPEPLLLRWDVDIRRAASAAARRTMLDAQRIEDLAQEARIRIVRLVRRGGPHNEPYVRTVISNAVRQAARRENAALQDPALGEQSGLIGASDQFCGAGAEGRYLAAQIVRS